jgi:hypothetical protein
MDFTAPAIQTQPAPANAGTKHLIYLGSFNTREDACAAYLAVKAILHPFGPVPRGMTTNIRPRNRMWAAHTIIKVARKRKNMTLEAAAWEAFQPLLPQINHARLPEPTLNQNRQNLLPLLPNSSGYFGAWLDKERNRKARWRTEIVVNNRRLRLGHFHNPQDAQAVYLAAKQIVHPLASLPQNAPAPTPNDRIKAALKLQHQLHRAFSPSSPKLNLIHT